MVHGLLTARQVGDGMRENIWRESNQGPNQLGWTMKRPRAAVEPGDDN